MRVVFKYPSPKPGAPAAKIPVPTGSKFLTVDPHTGNIYLEVDDENPTSSNMRVIAIGTGANDLSRLADEYKYLGTWYQESIDNSGFNYAWHIYGYRED